MNSNRKNVEIYHTLLGHPTPRIGIGGTSGLRWDQAPPPHKDRQRLFSPSRSVDEGPFRNRYRDIPDHLCTGSRERATDAVPASYALQHDRLTQNRPSRADARKGRSSPPTQYDMRRRLDYSPTTSQMYLLK